LARTPPPYSGGVEKTPLPPSRAPALASALRWLATMSLACAWGWAAAQAAPASALEPGLTPELALQVRQLVLDKLLSPDGPRVEVRLGQLDTRLRLAPCQKVTPYLPSGSRLWGPSRVGLRCTQGATPWNVYLPVTVSLYGPGVQAAADLPASHVLQASDLREAEIELTESRSPAWTELPRLVGRSLAHPVAAGQTLRHATLKPRQWFAAGDTVQLRGVGGGFTVAGSGEAMSAGMEGQTVRVRTESGKIVSGLPVAERQLEVHL
jgi:flagella basal body P-ring formation protein FlgA